MNVKSHNKRSVKPKPKPHAKLKIRPKAKAEVKVVVMAKVVAKALGAAGVNNPLQAG